MCGIAGIVTEKASEYENVAKRMIFSLAHRGPDGEKISIFDKCILAHRRLSIIDLKTGTQPMVSYNKKTSIVFNGEIYGYQKLRQSLNYPFLTLSDTEVILALYEKYGNENFLYHLPGMFAFALWDSEKNELVCARDRFGEKPFYYAFGKNGEFIFASEIKAILSSGIIDPILDLESVSHYLKHLYVHPQKTIYKNIFILPSAHTLRFHEGKTEIKRYWYMPTINESISLSEAVEEFKRLFENAIKKQLIADVPVGAFLSGGLDSSTIVALANRYNSKIRTFSFAFRNSINELPFARMIAEKYKTTHMELWDDAESLGNLLQHMQTVYDEPFGDSSNIPTYLISKFSSQYTKVALTGDGGDELLGGYGWYRFFYENKKRKISDNFFKNNIIRFASKVLHRLGVSQLRENVFRSHVNSFSSIFEAHTRGRIVVFDNNDISFLHLPMINESIISVPSWKLNGTLDDALRIDVENYMSGDILVKTDRAAMANSLELRAPFLDIDFASFCLSLPYRLKINKENDKIILRNAYSELWNKEIENRKKQGFGAPVNKWLHEDKSLKDLLYDYLFDSQRRIFSIIPFSKVKNIIKKKNYKTWTLLVLSLWMEKYKPKIE